MTAHPLKLDHLVIAARTLDEGARFIAATFGVESAAGGAHPLMRTHNRLLGLWGGAYLEVIAIDPAAPSPATPRPRLFALDDPSMQRRLEAGPQLVHWVARVDRPKSLVRWREQYPERIAPVVAMSRSGMTWGLTVPDDGAFPAWQGAGDGLAPALIQWDTPRHPGDTLPETGIALESLTGFHPEAESLAAHLDWLGAAHLMQVRPTRGAPVLVARFELPDGSRVTLGESADAVELLDNARLADDEARQGAGRRRRTRAKSGDAAPEASTSTSTSTSGYSAHANPEAEGNAAPGLTPEPAGREDEVTQQASAADANPLRTEGQSAEATAKAEPNNDAAIATLASAEAEDGSALPKHASNADRATPGAAHQPAEPTKDASGSASPEAGGPPPDPQRQPD